MGKGWDPKGILQSSGGGENLLEGPLRATKWICSVSGLVCSSQVTAGLSGHLIHADVSGDANDKHFSSQGILCCNPWPQVTWFKPKGVELMGQRD